MSRIIAFGGRKESGKSELAKICAQFGYKRVSFALPLKQLIATLIHRDISEINALKTVKMDWSFTEDDIAVMHDVTNIPIDILREKMLNRTFENVRELLQYIGTDVIRAYHNDWHVEQIAKMIDNDEKYVIDDVRFPNEKKMIEELGGTCWFVVRPKIDNVSNHESETSVSWKDFDNVIINDETRDDLIKNWLMIMTEGYDESLEKIKEAYHTHNAELMTKYMYFVKTIGAKLSYNNTFHLSDIERVGTHLNGVHVYFKDGTVLRLTNPLNIEDLKICVS
jgi:hypothetical protein